MCTPSTVYCVLCDVCVQSEESCIELGAQVVGTTSYRHLTIGNDSSCDVQYQLIVEQFISGPYGNDETLNNDQSLGIYTTSCYFIPAKYCDEHVCLSVCLLAYL